MLSEISVLIEVKSFRYKKNAFVIEDLAIITSKYSDQIIFSPPVNFKLLPKPEQNAYNWLTNKFIYTVSIGKTVSTFTYT